MHHTADRRSPDNVTGLLQAWSAGDPDAGDQLVPVVYAELRRLAGAHLRRERKDHTLQPTALVNEAFIRLIDVRQVHWKNRAYFFGAASQMMRRILVDHGRRRQAAKRDGGVTRVELGEAVGATEPRDVDLLALDAALDRLATLDARQSELVVLRFFGGLTLDEAAEVMHISTGTVKRDWTTARAWLHRELVGEPHDA